MENLTLSSILLKIDSWGMALGFCLVVGVIAYAIINYLNNKKDEFTHNGIETPPVINIENLTKENKKTSVKKASNKKSSPAKKVEKPTLTKKVNKSTVSTKNKKSTKKK